MRIYPGTTVDYEFATLGDLGYTGTLNDRQFAALRAEGLTGSLPDMFGQFDGELEEEDPWADALALITDTKGWAFDANDASLIFDDTARTVPATASTQISAAVSASSTLGWTWQQDSAAFKPVWTGLSLDFDGLDDYLDADAADGSTITSMRDAVTGGTFCCKFRLSTIGSIQNLLSTSRWNSNAFGGLIIRATAANEISCFHRRVDGDVGVTLATAGLGLLAATDYLLTVRMDHPTQAHNIRVGGVQVASGSAYLGATTNAGATQRVRIGRSISATEPLDGLISRAVWLPYYVDGDDLLTLEAGINASALV
jgi:hypothetical protein